LIYQVVGEVFLSFCKNNKNTKWIYQQVVGGKFKWRCRGGRGVADWPHRPATRRVLPRWRARGGFFGVVGPARISPLAAGGGVTPGCGLL